MPELRLNLITREWVIVEKATGVNPVDFIEKRAVKKLPEYLDACHFCFGNEGFVPDEVHRIEGEKGWAVRVVRNKFSRLSAEGAHMRWSDRLQRSANAVGVHEIVIETPFHNLSTADLHIQQLKSVIETYRKRFIEMYKDTRVEYVVIFKEQRLLKLISSQKMKEGAFGSGIIAAGLGLLISLVYWFGYSLFLSLGYAGTIPPIVAPWIVPIIFAGVSVYLYSQIPE